MRRIIGIIAGIAAMVIGVFVLLSHFNAQKTQVAEATATVIRIDSEVQTDTDGLDNRMYYPVVEYTIDGKTYESRLDNTGTSNSAEFKEGQEIAIQYNPDNPEELSKKGDKGGLVGGIIFIALGLVAIGASILGKI